MQCKKRNGNNLKNEMTIEILVNYFFSKINIFSPRNTENDNLTSISTISHTPNWLTDFINLEKKILKFTKPIEIDL